MRYMATCADVPYISHLIHPCCKCVSPVSLSCVLLIIYYCNRVFIVGPQLVVCALSYERCRLW